MVNLYRFTSVVAVAALIGLGACSDDDGSGSDSATTGTSGTSTSGDQDEDEATSDDPSTSDDSASTGDEEEEETTTGFIGGTDLAVIETCDPWKQDCPDGEKCIAFSTGGGAKNTPQCHPIADNPNSTGDECAGEEDMDDCDATSYCTGCGGVRCLCIDLCTGSPEAPMCPQGAQQACSIDNGGTLLSCTAICNPLTGDTGGCEPGVETCLPNGDDTNFVCTTMYEEPAQPNEPCGGINSCREGLICWNGLCTGYCDTEQGNAECADFKGGENGDLDTQCVRYFEPGDELPGLDTLGLCVIPED